MVRVLHVTECYAGGVRHAIRTIVSLTPEHEHHLLWTGDDVPDRDNGYTSTTKMAGSVIRRVWQIRKRAREIGADLLHAHSSWAGFYTRVFPQPIPVIYQPHAYVLAKPDLSGWKKAFYHTAEKYLAGHTDAVVALTDAEARIASSISPRTVIFRLPNVASVRPLERVGRRFPNGNRQPQVITVGRLCAQKDPGFFLRTSEIVHKQRPDVRFVWAGDGDQEAKQQLENGDVHVTGWLESEDLERELCEADMYLHTASYEGFPISVLDAAAFNLPIVVRDIPALEAVDLLRGRSERECAGLIIGMLYDRAQWHKAIDQSEALDAAMHPSRQAEMLGHLYESQRWEEI